MSVATALARWANTHAATPADLRLADLSVCDTTAVALAARGHRIGRLAQVLDPAGSGGSVAGAAARWAVLAHVLDFDDLHLPSTTHISTVCLPAALACAPADPELARRSYLAGAGVMARLGMALGWAHYTNGWHATTTAGAPAAAVTAGVAMGLPTEQLGHAIALSIPAAGGVQRAFGTDAKSLQVGMATAAGVTAARLAAAGARADLGAVEAWLALVHGDPDLALLHSPEQDPDAVPGGLAMKVYPACYALQRPIAALRQATGTAVDADRVIRVRLITPRGTVTPLVHHRPRTGLEGKFSLEYAVATALLDDYSGFEAFGDEAVQRADARRVMERTEIELTDGGDGLLDGEVTVHVELDTTGSNTTGSAGGVVTASLSSPPGVAGDPQIAERLGAKAADCLRRAAITDLSAADLTWETAAEVLRTHLDADHR